LQELGDIDDSLKFNLKKPEQTKLPDDASSRNITALQFEKGKEIATREVYGQALAKAGEQNPAIYALDADVKNSTFSQDFLKAVPNHFVECYIAEQNMVSVAAGFSRVGKIPFVSTFAAFLVRAADQIRMARVGEANIKFCGSHVGVSIGEDGPSQMGLEDISMFGSIPDTIVLQPCDGVSTAKLIPQMISNKGMVYMRTLRPKTSVIYDNAEEFPIGGSKILRQSADDKLTVVATGITVSEALKAADELKKEGISIRVIDCYSIKPIDATTLKKCLNETKAKIIITVEDHFEHGGMGDFVLQALEGTGARVEKMAVRKISSSGLKDELMDDAGINASHIIAKVKELVK